MTEAQWLAATDPAPMLAYLRVTATDRKLRLFACACVRSVWNNAQNEFNLQGFLLHTR